MGSKLALGFRIWASLGNGGPSYKGYKKQYLHQGTRAVSSLYPYPLHFLLFISFSFAFLRLVLKLSSFQIQPTVAEHEELIWLVGNLKLEVTRYSRQIYGPSGYAYLDDDDDDDDNDPEATQSSQPRKRHYWRWSYR